MWKKIKALIVAFLLFCFTLALMTGALAMFIHDGSRLIPFVLFVLSCATSMCATEKVFEVFGYDEK